jgi:hypothetical protein
VEKGYDPLHSTMRLLRWSIAVAAAVVICLVAFSAWLLQPRRLGPRVTAALSAHLGLEATLDSLSLTWLPRPRLAGQGLTLRVPERPDLPPFIFVERFSLNVGLFSALRGHVREVHFDGLSISVPPPGSRGGLPSQRGATNGTKVIIDVLNARNTKLTLLRRQPGQAPLVFDIHELEIQSLGFARQMPFRTKLTNPVPRGLVESQGTFGPWSSEGPSAVPVNGDYTFSDADLGTINGIGGRLSSRGHYHGPITALLVRGETVTPDFNLDLGGKPVPLTATFNALVDGSNGTTRLQLVEARLFNTGLRVTGAITNLDGPGRYDVQLMVEVTDGRIEDVLRLAIDSPEPLLMGDVTLRTSLVLPPGSSRVRDRIAMDGRFGLAGARFTDRDIQKRLDELSRRSQGQNKEIAASRVMTDLTGRFTVASGVLTLPRLTFGVPGASIELAGTYGFAHETIDFHGSLRMRATVSQAVGGFKSIFIRPFDFIFREGKTGAVIPISITGTRQQPKMKANLFGGKKK